MQRYTYGFSATIRKMPSTKESAVVESGYMIDRGDLNRADEKYKNILNLLDSCGISHLFQDRVRILTTECNELKANAEFEGDSLRSRVKDRDIIINPETLSALLRLPTTDVEDPWDEVAFHRAMTFMRYTGDTTKHLLKKNFPEEFKFLAEILGKAFLCKPSAHFAVSQDMMRAMAAVAMQRRMHWGRYLFNQIRSFFCNSHHGRILTIFLNKLDCATFPIDTGKPIHHSRIINLSLFDKWKVRIVPKVTQASSPSHVTPPPPPKRTTKKLTIKHPTKKSRQASSTIVINEPPCTPSSPSSPSSESSPSSSSEGFERTLLSLTKSTPPPRHTNTDILPLPSSFQLSPTIPPSSRTQVIDRTIHLTISPNISIATPLAQAGTSVAEIFVEQVEGLAQETVLGQGSPSFASDLGGPEDRTRYDIEDELNFQDIPKSYFAQHFDRNMLKEILREVVKEEMKVVREEMTNMNEMMAAISRENERHWNSIEHKISVCVREISTINILFGDVQRLPERMISLEDKFVRLEEIIEYEVKKGEDINEKIKQRVDQAMQSLREDIKYLKAIVKDKFVTTPTNNYFFF